MAGGSRRRRRSSSPPPPAAAAGDDRDWSSLPQDALLTIAALLFSFTHLAAFSSVCRAWRAAAALSVKTAPQIRPPLLISRAKGKRYWRLHDPALPAAHSRLNLSLRVLGKKGARIVGVSRGRVIVDGEDQDALSVINPLSGDAVCSPPPLPLPLGNTKSSSVIAAHFLHATTLLVLLNTFESDRTYALRWSVGAEEWTFAQCGRRKSFHQLAALPDGRLFALGRFQAIFSVHHEEDEDDEDLPGIAFYDNLPDLGLLEFCSYPVACGETLIYLHLSVNLGELVIKAFRVKECTAEELDSQELGGAFVPLEQLGDWAIFLALRDGVPPVVCRNPERWGGRSGCIYIDKCSYLAEVQSEDEDEDEDNNGDKGEDFDGGSWDVVDFDNVGGWTSIELCSRDWHSEFQRSPQVMVAAPCSWDSFA